MIISHNLAAMNAQRQLNVNTKTKAKSSEKLSSGYRINRAADDAAGLAISEKMRRQIRGLDQGIDNIQDGISLCQIADGALNETHEILQRMNELSVKAANGTLEDSDRAYINEEVKHLTDEIDHIANSTNFNDAVFPLLGGKYTTVTIPGGSISFDDISFEKWDSSSSSMAKWPFTESDPLSHIKLTATVDNAALHGLQGSYDLIYENGRTNYSAVYVSYNDGNGVNGSIKVNYSQLTEVKEFVPPTESSQSVSRTFSYKDPNVEGLSFDITQKVTLDADNKSYQIDTSLTNTGSVNIGSYLFAQHFDTSFGGNHAGDFQENYFVGGNKVNNENVWGNLGTTNVPRASMLSILQQTGATDLMALYNKMLVAPQKPDSVPQSISIANINQSSLGLPFAEYIELSDEDGLFLSVGKWDRRDDLSSIAKDYVTSNGSMGSLDGQDLAFTYFTYGDSTMRYGIKDVEQDSNINGSVTKGADLTVQTFESRDIWIQASSEPDDGLYLQIVDATAAAIGVDNVDLSTRESALSSIGIVKNGIEKVNNFRTIFGSQQNRLEHMTRQQSNAMENVQSSESKIRDTDMSSEMVRLSNLNILQQAGQTILAQANQTNNGILSLLS